MARLGRSDPQGQSFSRAARWIERDSIDVVAVARDGNLKVVQWLEEPASTMVNELSAGTGSPSMEALRRDYFAGAAELESESGPADSEHDSEDPGPS